MIRHVLHVCRLRWSFEAVAQLRASTVRGVKRQIGEAVLAVSGSRPSGSAPGALKALGDVPTQESEAGARRGKLVV